MKPNLIPLIQNPNLKSLRLFSWFRTVNSKEKKKQLKKSRILATPHNKCSHTTLPLLWVHISSYTTCPVPLSKHPLHPPNLRLPSFRFSPIQPNSGIHAASPPHLLLSSTPAGRLSYTAPFCLIHPPAPPAPLQKPPLPPLPPPLPHGCCPPTL